MEHDWLPTTVGHGELICRRCWGTNRELAALGQLTECPGAWPPAQVAAGLPVPATAPKPGITIEYNMLDDEDGLWISIRVSGQAYGEIGPFETAAQREEAYRDIQKITYAETTTTRTLQ